uniref:hypothetical protein n=1 Tax=Photorhabdus sp. RM322S TaxID=3342825 RepID=UPI0036DC14A2
MLVVSSFEVTESGRRTQPWNKTENAIRDGQYYDLRQNPELIETSLEDFYPYSDQPAVQTFYSMLKWINSNDSCLESTDCLLSGEPIQNVRAKLFSCSHEITGRFEFFIREYELNTSKDTIGWVYDKLSLYLQIERPNFRKGSFRIAPLVTDYITPAGDKLKGYRFCIYFQAYGDGIDDTWLSLNTAFNGLFETLKRLNFEMFSGRAEPLYKAI